MENHIKMDDLGGTTIFGNIHMIVVLKFLFAHIFHMSCFVDGSEIRQTSWQLILLFAGFDHMHSMVIPISEASKIVILLTSTLHRMSLEKVAMQSEDHREDEIFH